jgi:hypothetical protein
LLLPIGTYVICTLQFAFVATCHFQLWKLCVLWKFAYLI